MIRVETFIGDREDVNNVILSVEGTDQVKITIDSPDKRQEVTLTWKETSALVELLYFVKDSKDSCFI